MAHTVLPLCLGKMIRLSKKERVVRRLWHISPQPRARAVSSSRLLAEVTASVGFDVRLVASSAGGIIDNRCGVGVVWRMHSDVDLGGPPATKVRNTNSRRGWLKPENRCLVPANSFAEYAPKPNP